MAGKAGWATTTVGAVLSLEYGKGLSGECRTGNGFPVFGSSGEVGRHAESICEGPGIVVGRKGTVGSVTWSDEPFWPIDTTYYVRRLVDVNLRWLFWRLLTINMAALDSSTGVPGLNRNDAYRLMFEFPPAAEQRRIAAILDTLDEAIRRTEQVIAKLQQMKHGLLHDLLTRGVDEYGDLRPPPDEAPHLYKGSPLGRIPMAWSVKRVEEALELLLDFRGRTPKKLGMEWGGGDIPALSAKNVRVGRVDLEQETYYGSSRLYEKWMTKGDAEQGDVLFTTEAPLGNVAQVPDERRFILSQRVVLLRFDHSVALNDYMAFQLADERCQSNMKRWSSGTTATGIQMAKMVLIPIVLPPVAEQAVQVEMAKAADERITAELSLLAKYRITKLGLLHDLLSGCVRVPLPTEGVS